MNFGQLLHSLGPKSHAIAAILLVLPFLQPIPMAGLSTLFGAVHFILGTMIALQKDAWLPQKLAKVELPSKTLILMLDGAEAICRKLEWVIKPRLVEFSTSKSAHIGGGILIAIAGAVLALPLPIPFSNMLPAIVILCMSLALLEEDGVLWMVGTVFFFIVLVLLPYGLFLLWQKLLASEMMQNLLSSF